MRDSGYNKKYQHVERLFTEEVEGLLDGLVTIQPKIDGSNGVVWFEGGEIKAGSRNRELTLDNDNQGFYAWVLSMEEDFKQVFSQRPNLVLYMEWLVKHTIGFYEKEAYQKGYIFDGRENNQYLSYQELVEVLKPTDLELVPILAIVDGSDLLDEDYINMLLDSNTYLLNEKAIAEGKRGEGIVIKRTNFINKYGRTTWGKVVCDEFKQKNVEVFGAPASTLTIYDRIIQEFVTESFIEKEYQKMVQDTPWSSKRIPELLGRIWKTFIDEESYNMVKKFKNPTIDYKVLLKHVNDEVKQVKSELF